MSASSDKPSTNKPSDNKSWEAWQLTAFVLGELEPEQAQRIAAAAVVDKALAQELASISSTLDDLRSVLDRESISSAMRCLSAADSNTAAGGDEQLPSFESIRAQCSNASAMVAESEVSIAPCENNQRAGHAHWRQWAALAAVLLVGLTIWLAPELRERLQHTVASKTSVTKDAVSNPLQSSLVGDHSTFKRNEAGIDYVQPSFAAGELRLDSTEGMAGIGGAGSMDDMNRRNVSSPYGDRRGGMQGAGYGSGAYAEQKEDGLAQSSLEVGSTNTPLPQSLEAPPEIQFPAAPTSPAPLNPAATIAAASSAEKKWSAPGLPADGYPLGYSLPLESTESASADQSRSLSLATPAIRTLEDEQAEMEQLALANDESRSQGLDAGVELSDPFAATLAKGLPSEPATRYRRSGGMPSSGRSEFDLRTSSQSGDRYAATSENQFAAVTTAPLSTFSIDVDTASYTKARQYLLEHRQLPPPDAVRIEEFINYFDYRYQPPADDEPFAAALAVTECPWQTDHELVRIALQAKQVAVDDRPKANLVFLLDVSGSMDEPNKLPLVQETMRLLARQLTENDRVAMVVYAGAAGCVLESTRGNEQEEILAAIERLEAGGSTNGGQGIQLVYSIAREHFIPGGINRVILCTDGDFNVGVTDTEQLVDLVAENAKSKVFLTVLGYGIGNLNDAMLEKISNRGNGVYAFVDSRREAQRQMVKQLAGNLITVAKDVKIQVEFNPAKVASYRLIGYENRRLAAEDFNNDKKDAGEIGAGHRVTALYQIVPVRASEAGSVEPLRYQSAAVKPRELESSEHSDELLTVKLRYKRPEGDKSHLQTFPLEDTDADFSDADRDFRWSAAVAEFGLLLRDSQHKGNASWPALIERATAAAGKEPDRTRTECLEMMRVAASHEGRAAGR